MDEQRLAAGARRARGRAEDAGDRAAGEPGGRRSEGRGRETGGRRGGRPTGEPGPTPADRRQRRRPPGCGPAPDHPPVDPARSGAARPPGDLGAPGHPADGPSGDVRVRRGRLVGTGPRMGRSRRWPWRATRPPAAARDRGRAQPAAGSWPAPGRPPGSGAGAHRTASLIVLAVDASGSMGAPQRMEAAKGAVLGLLTDAYQRRDLVGLVAFRGEQAEVLLRPTGSVEVARARLAGLPTGGRTPLAAGITTALGLATAPARAASHRPVPGPRHRRSGHALPRPAVTPWTAAASRPTPCGGPASTPWSSTWKARSVRPPGRAPASAWLATWPAAWADRHVPLPGVDARGPAAGGALGRPLTRANPSELGVLAVGSPAARLPRTSSGCPGRSQAREL